MDPLTKAAEEKCLSLETIHETLKESEILRDESLKLIYRVNPLTDKPEAAEFSLGRFRVNISANVSRHPVTDECINQKPFEVISWQDNSFHLEEGCETPPDSGITRKVFENADSSIEYLLKQIADVQSRS